MDRLSNGKKLHQFSVLRQSVPLRDINFCSKHFSVRLRVYYKSSFDRLTICPSFWMLQTDFRFCLNGVHVWMGYMSECGTCLNGVHVWMGYIYPIQHEVFGCLLVEKIFLNKAWIIGALCELSIYVLRFCLKLRFKGIVWMGYILETYLAASGGH